jgi:putative ABC transport system substrate-binding protein
MSNLAAELPGKRLEILKEMVPQSTRIAVLANPANASHASDLHHVTEAARALGLSLHLVEVRRAEELESAFAAMTRAGADALMVLSDSILLSQLPGRIVDLAATHRLPAIYVRRVYVEGGGLMSYGPSLPDLYRRAAAYVDKILKGAKPAELPVEQPMKFELVLNLKTAKALGFTFPPAILFQADEVIR